MERKPKKLLILAILLGVLVVINWLVGYYTDWLWFRSLDYSSVFWRVIQARFGGGVLFGILAALLVGTNLWVAGRFTRYALRMGGGAPLEEGELPGEGLLRSWTGYLVAGAVLVFVLGSVGAAQWPMLLRYWYDQPFGMSDPIFGRDVGFYVFSLPFYRFVAYFLMGGLVVSGVMVGLVYAAAGGIRFQERFQVLPRPLAHFSALGGLFLLDMAWIYRLKVYGLLYSQGRIAFGAAYVDVNVQIWAYWLLVILFLGASALLFINVRSRGTRLPIMGAGLLVGGAIVVGAVPSAVVQKLVVEPSELKREAPYIEHNIRMTRQAYGLDQIEEQPFEASEELTRADVEANPLTVRNVRIWDERPLAQTYQQVQEIRPYYLFPNVDVDRYTIDGVYRQVMLSAREIFLDRQRLPSQTFTFVNERLKYTHGYGVALSPVNHVTPEGLPAFMVKDIPPVSISGLEIDRPEVYYGERTYPYVVVKASTPEFDYPRGDENQYTTYQGAGGVPMGGFFDRLAFTVRFKDVNLLLSSYITGESRIMFRRQIAERVRTIVPFLFYDSDPYLVISEGKLYWIQDAYTTTDMYPYSARTGRGGINYIRNSVKVVVDAYNGTVRFYRVDLEDPIIEVYAKIFPGLFTPLKEMPEGLRAHLRYPIDLFRIQAARYRDYHMRDVQVFYNQEDLWEIPNEIYSERAQMMQPYYIIIKLPGEEEEEFLLMVPYTPAKKDNMIAWLAARCDGENYGHLLVYKLPKDKLIFGPMQLEARIDQQPEISSQLTLWGQRGSQVIRGNLLAIPIERSFVYVEPIYLQARQEPEEQAFGQEGEEGLPGGQRQGFRQDARRSTAIPELKQVIVAFAGRVVMRETLEEGLTELFGAREEPEAARPEEAGSTPSAGEAVLPAGDLAAQVEARYQNVRSALQRWDWAQAGEEMVALERAIGALRKALAGN